MMLVLHAVTLLFVYLSQLNETEQYVSVSHPAIEVHGEYTAQTFVSNTSEHSNRSLLLRVSLPARLLVGGRIPEQPCTAACGAEASNGDVPHLPMPLTSLPVHGPANHHP